MLDVELREICGLPHRTAATVLVSTKRHADFVARLLVL